MEMNILTKDDVRDFIIELLGELEFKYAHPYGDDEEVLEVYHEDGWVCEVPLMR